MPELKRPLKVFLSYASQDKPVVRELSGRLASEGWIDSWVDEKKLLPGQDWRLKIEEAVETSDIVIICLSSNSVSKEGYVQKELRYAREIALEKPEDAIFLIPLRLDECEVPRGLRFYQWVDYFGERKEEAFSALVESLKLRYEQKLKIEEEFVRREKERQEHEAVEKARAEAKELARQKAAKEKAERELAEKAVREKAEKEAAEKEQLEAEELTRRKLAKEKAEREVAEKAVREKAEKETAKKAQLEVDEQARQKAAKEKVEREIVEKISREKVEREAVEKTTLEQAEIETVEETAREQENRESAEKPKQEKVEGQSVEKTKFESVKSESGQKAATSEATVGKFAFGTMGILGIVVVCIIGILIVFSLINSPGGNAAPTNIEPTSDNSIPVNPEPTLGNLVATNPAPTIKSPVSVNTGTASTTTVVSLPEITDTKGILMNLVPAGDFMLGSDQTLFLDTFYVDKYEVTNASYKACFDDSGCLQRPQNDNSNTRAIYYGNPEFDNYPVIYVDWYMAKTYCEWRGARLPTEAEWEKAARGTDGRVSPWGNAANFNDFSHDNTGKGNSGDTTEVGSYETGKSPYNVYDMGGNVWEWVSSIYKSYPYDPNDGRENLDISGMRVLRGGSWKSMGIEDQTNYRYRLEPTSAKNDIGFRCARDANP